MQQVGEPMCVMWLHRWSSFRLSERISPRYRQCVDPDLTLIVLSSMATGTELLALGDEADTTSPWSAKKRHSRLRG